MGNGKGLRKMSKLPNTWLQMGLGKPVLVLAVALDVLQSPAQCPQDQPSYAWYDTARILVFFLLVFVHVARSVHGYD